MSCPVSLDIRHMVKAAVEGAVVEVKETEFSVEEKAAPAEVPAPAAPKAEAAPRAASKTSSKGKAKKR